MLPESEELAIILVYWCSRLKFSFGKKFLYKPITRTLDNPKSHQTHIFSLCKVITIKKGTVIMFSSLIDTIVYTFGSGSEAFLWSSGFSFAILMSEVHPAVVTACRIRSCTTLAVIARKNRQFRGVSGPLLTRSYFVAVAVDRVISHRWGWPAWQHLVQPSGPALPPSRGYYGKRMMWRPSRLQDQAVLTDASTGQLQEIEDTKNVCHSCTEVRLNMLIIYGWINFS